MKTIFIAFIGFIGLCGCYRDDYYYYEHLETNKVEYASIPDWQRSLRDSTFYIKYFSDRDDYICPPSMLNENTFYRYPFFRVGKYAFTVFDFASIPADSLRTKFLPLSLTIGREIKGRLKALLIIDTISKEVLTHPNGILNNSNYAHTFRSENYVYIEFLKDFNLSGGWKDTMYYNPGIILISKSNPLNISQYSFSNEYIHIIQELPNKQLRVVTDRIEFNTSYLTYIVSQLAGHTPAQYMNTTNEFYEYIFDSTMYIKTKRKLDEGNKDVIVIKEHHISRYVDSVIEAIRN